MTYRHTGKTSASSVSDQFVIGAAALCGLVGVSLFGVLGSVLGSLV